MALNEGDFDFPEADLVKKTEICKVCKNIVVGKGNIQSKILFVGESPGKKEDEQGFPFVGTAGKNLDKLFFDIDLSLQDVYITNILKCQPPKNRNPSVEEIKLHTPWLIKQIKEMKPLVICSLGNYATKFILSNGDVDEMKNQFGITLLHGKLQKIEFQGLKINLIPLFHPAAIIYNQKLKPLWEKDMKIVKKIIKNALD